MATIANLENMIGDVEVLKGELRAEHDANQEKFRREHETKLKEVEAELKGYIGVFNKVFDSKVEEVEGVLSEVLKKEPIAGVHFTSPKDAPPADEKAIEERVVSRIRQPVDGETPVIDYKKIAKLAVAFIPKPKDGITPNHDEIVEKVFEELHKGKRKLSVKHIGDFTDGLEQTMRPIRSMIAGFRGGGDVVTAGSNITITTDSNGKKVITGLSGAGFTPLTATETPDGSITVFTFALASTQPSFILADGVWKEPTDQDGVTVNWTWDAGTKKATLTIPPISGIKGIV